MERSVKESVLKVENVSKIFSREEGSFGQKKLVENHVIDQVTFDVYENEFLVIFGPGQSGKTTLLKMMAGLEKVTDGIIEFGQKKISGPNPQLGFVYQSIALFPWLTVMENVEFGPKVKGEGKVERREKAQHYIELVGLGGFEERYPAQLSGGMKQRVGIARAYANNPKILLMDEPFGALDAQTRYMMEAEIQKIWQKEKRTVVFVTNNIEEALFLADRIILLTNCPTKIKSEYHVSLPHPRSYVDKEFLKLRQEITNNMDRTL
ncbi:ABC transporter ATP-binding protein [Vagococcus elongatus]|uniref:ABC transporter n=1 Tax=Vagococcus elongatus TaxID=180344 RepID=A0A430AI21_9ENTE|nr:ABC transporter ATP-binding protein [Vagococcus elongatus]RSU07653.1 ABC transporter [Vagococcus elongatus]